MIGDEPSQGRLVDLAHNHSCDPASPALLSAPGTLAPKAWCWRLGALLEFTEQPRRRNTSRVASTGPRKHQPQVWLADEDSLGVSSQSQAPTSIPARGSQWHDCLPLGEVSFTGYCSGRGVPGRGSHGLVCDLAREIGLGAPCIAGIEHHVCARDLVPEILVAAVPKRHEQQHPES